MKRRITRKSLEELQRALSILSLQEQTYYVGRGNGSKEDPYTFVEYQDLLSRKSWLGGYVMGSYETYTRDESGDFVKSVFNESIYISKDEHLLNDVIVYGKYPRDDEDYYSRLSGIYLDTENETPSGVFYPVPSGNWIVSENIGGSGGGDRNESYQNTNNPPYVNFYSTSSKFKAKRAYDVLLTIQKDPVFKALLQELNVDYKSKLVFDYKNFNNKARRGETHYDSNSTEIKIYLNEQTIDTRSKIGLAVTIVHELLHAKLHAQLRTYINNNPKCISVRDVKGANGLIERRKYLDLSMLPKTFSQKHKEFYEALTLSNGDIDAAHHEYIYRNAAIYAADLAQIFGVKNNTKAVESLFYSGLKDSPSYQKLSERQRDEVRENIEKLDPQIVWLAKDLLSH